MKHIIYPSRYPMINEQYPNSERQRLNISYNMDINPGIYPGGSMYPYPEQFPMNAFPQNNLINNSSQRVEKVKVNYKLKSLKEYKEKYNSKENTKEKEKEIDKEKDKKPELKKGRYLMPLKKKKENEKEKQLEKNNKSYIINPKPQGKYSKIVIESKEKGSNEKKLGNIYITNIPLQKSAATKEKKSEIKPMNNDNIMKISQSNGFKNNVYKKDDDELTKQFMSPNPHKKDDDLLTRQFLSPNPYKYNRFANDKDNNNNFILSSTGEIENLIDKKNQHHYTIQEKSQKIFDNMFNDMIGNNLQLESPIKNEKGENMKKFIIYTDFTASGKGLRKMEEFISKQVLPTYANVHSTVGHCAEITSNYMNEAKNILRDYTNAKGYYSIIFHGQGATGGVHKLIELLSIKKYVAFYNNLKIAYESKEKFGNNIVEDLKSNLITKIKEQFNDLFININFCFKFKQNENNKINCILCQKNFESEGYYQKHIQEAEHLQNLEKYNGNSEQRLFEMHGQAITDFIDIIRKNYNISSKASILKLINDYEKFKPVIFNSLYEHNSNSLSWRETQCEIVLIDGECEIFYENLKNKLDEFKNSYIKIGSFTASSNITGLLLDVDKIASMMHKENGFAFFDYAAGAPYLKIDLTDPLPQDYRDMLHFTKLNDYELKTCFKDGMFFSPHKFVGGPNTPGVLIVHDRIHRNQLKPTQAGGGTVIFVYKNNIDYILDPELKEESGTPNIIGSIRLGLMISIISKISHKDILLKEEEYIDLFLSKLGKIPNLYILHDNLLKNMPHIPVFSLMISSCGKFLHPNYICALLNDLFGIQSRPGCSCAPNYGKYLLGFDNDKEKFKTMEKLIEEGKEIFRPGYARLNLPYFYPKYIIEYVIDSIKFICEYGYLLLGLYNYDITSGKFYYYNSSKLPYSLKLFNFDEKYPKDLYDETNHKLIFEKDLKKTFEETRQYIMNQVFLKETFYIENNIIKEKRSYEEFGENENIRWFCIFKDVRGILKKKYFMELFSSNFSNLYSDEQVKNILAKLEEKGDQNKTNWSILK